MLREETIKKMKEELGFTDEQIQFVENEVYKEFFFKNGYKIRCGSPCYIFRQVAPNGKEFFKAMLYGKNIDGSKKDGYKGVEFIQCEKPKGERNKIIIKSFQEDFYKPKIDKYHDRFILKIFDWEYANEETQERFENNTALNEYSTTISDDDLPF